MILYVGYFGRVIFLCEGLGEDMGRTWGGHGEDLGRTWGGLGEDMRRTWGRHGEDLGMTGGGLGEDIVSWIKITIYFEIGSNLMHVAVSWSPEWQRNRPKTTSKNHGVANRHLASICLHCRSILAVFRLHVGSMFA
jgi:hypothetical protein